MLVRLVCVLAVAAVAAGSLGDNSLEGSTGERVVLVAPVLAPPRGSRTHGNDRSRQFPILVLLAQQGQHSNERVHPEAKSLEGNPQPIYVKKLEDQDRPHSREKRTLKKKLFGHFKGGGFGGHHGGYQQPSQVVVYKVYEGHHHSGGGGNYGHSGGHGYGGGGGGGYGGGYGNGYHQPGGYSQPSGYSPHGGCGGGCGGGYNNGGATAIAIATANGR